MVYTRCQRLALVVTLFVALIMLVVGGTLGYLGGHKTYDGGVNLMDQAVTAIDEMLTLNENVKAAFLSLGQFYGGSANYDDTAVTASINDVKDIISDAKDAMTNIKDIFNYALPGFYGFCAAITILGFLSWICGVACCSMTMGMIASVLLFLSWIFFAVFWASGAFLDDTCYELSKHYFLDCMEEPGKTCTRAKLTDFFQCPKVSTVTEYYTKAWNLLDTASANGAGTNPYGWASTMINKGYDDTGSTYNSKTVAPGWFAAGSSTCSDNTGSSGVASCTTDNLGMEPYTTCSTTNSPIFNVLDSSLTTIPTPINGNRRTLCRSGSTNSGIDSPQDAGLTAESGSTNPVWDDNTCRRACLNASATSGTDLDSLTNFGGNCMFRKFVYESFTTVYDSTQGYASCASSLKWETNNYIVSPELYQNYTSWMSSYAAMKTAGSECVSSSDCAYVGTNREIPWTTGGGSNPACMQAAAMSVSDIMFALSYIASCAYIKSFGLLTAVKPDGACFDLGDGLVMLIAAQGLVGAAFFIVTIVGVMGYRRFNMDHDAGNKKSKEESDDQDLYAAAGINPEDTANDEHLPYLKGGVSTTEMVPLPSNSSAQGNPAHTRDQWV